MASDDHSFGPIGASNFLSLCISWPTVDVFEANDFEIDESK